MRSRLSAHTLSLGVALGLAALSLLSFLDIVPGLHGDEAWAGYRAHRIATEGFRPSFGMNAYTGPVHQYLLAPVLQWLGYTVFALRLPTVLASLATVLLSFHIVRRVFGGRVAAIAVLLLVSLPFFSVYGRTATETSTINPLCAAGGVLCLIIGADPLARQRRLIAALGGVLFGIGTWTHLIFVPVAIATVVAAVVVRGTALVRSRGCWAACAGFVVGLTPRLIQLAGHVGIEPEFGLGAQVGTTDLLAGLGRGVGARAREWPGLFLDALHGDLLFLRYAGEVAWPTPAFHTTLAAATLALLAGRYRASSPPERRSLVAVLVSLPVMLGLTLVITTQNSDRYFLLPLYLVPLWFALAIDWGWQMWGARGLVRRVVPSAIAALVALNLARVSVNLHAAHLQSGGKGSPVQIGHQVDTSNHFVRTDQLYAYLIAHNARHVMTEFFIGVPLRFYDLAHPRFDTIVLVEDAKWTEMIPADLLIVAYRGGPRRLSPERLRPPLAPTTVVYEDSHFIVWR